MHEFKALLYTSSIIVTWDDFVNFCSQSVKYVYFQNKIPILTAANFGRSKNDDKKQRKIAIEYVRLCGYKNGEIGNGRKKECQNGIPKLTLEEIASQLGTSKRDLQRVLSIERNLTDSMKELLDTGNICYIIFLDNIYKLRYNMNILYM